MWANYWNSFNDISAFPFENKLQTLKRYVRSAHNPLSQVWKRLQEIHTCGYQHEFKPTKTYMSTKMEKDSIFYLKESRQFAMVQKHRKKRYDAQLMQIDNVDNFFHQPCPSKFLSIAHVKDWRNQHLTKTVISRKQLHPQGL